MRTNDSCCRRLNLGMYTLAETRWIYKERRLNPAIEGPFQTLASVSVQSIIGRAHSNLQPSFATRMHACPLRVPTQMADL